MVSHWPCCCGNFLKEEMQCTSFPVLCVSVAKSCPILCNCSLSVSCVLGILQARILEWVAIPFSWDLPNPGIKPRSPTLQADSLLSEPLVKPQTWAIAIYRKKQTLSRNVQRISSTGTRGGFDRLDNSFANHWHHLEENLPKLKLSCPVVSNSLQPRGL